MRGSSNCCVHCVYLGSLHTLLNLLGELAGSHTVLSLLDHNYTVTIVDNLDNAFEEAYRRMQELASSKAKNMKFIKVAYWHTWPCRAALVESVVLSKAI